MKGEGLERYVLSGGDDGRARLAVIARVLGEPTRRLLDRHVPAAGGIVVDAGCGGVAATRSSAESSFVFSRVRDSSASTRRWSRRTDATATSSGCRC